MMLFRESLISFQQTRQQNSSKFDEKYYLFSQLFKSSVFEFNYEREVNQLLLNYRDQSIKPS